MNQQIHDESTLRAQLDSSTDEILTSPKFRGNSVRVDIEKQDNEQEENHNFDYARSSSFDHTYNSDKSGNGFDNDENFKIGHTTVLSKRKLKICCIGSTVGLVLFILLVSAFQAPRPSPSCDSGMSPPFVSNRSVNYDYCYTHQVSNWQNSDLVNFLTSPTIPSLRFLVFGDFGRDGFCCQRDVAIELERAAKSTFASFIVNTGDSFYGNGITNIKNEQIRTSFLNVYNTPTLKQLQFWSVLGNHDYRGDSNAILQLHNAYQRFNILGRYYANIFKTETLALQIIFIDTSPMIESYKIPGYDDPNDYILKAPNGIKTQWAQVETQMDWILGRVTANKPVNARIVVGHHGIFGYSSHTNENRTFLQTRLAPILEAYNVTAYFAGHEHNLQMVQNNPKSTAYFISGAGSKLAPASAVSDTNSKNVRFYFMENGFLSCSLFANELRVAVVNAQGAVLDTVILPVSST